MPYEIEITPEGLRHLNRLPDKVRAAVVGTVYGSVAESPQRAGKPLRGELEGLYSARRGEFRVIYEIDEAARVVLIDRAQHRRSAYRALRAESRTRDGRADAIRAPRDPHPFGGEDAPPIALPTVMLSAWHSW